jgi:urate oxidase / 2-oxo-4-hydroxy-4-carboxy-5-ureidoimidazoline decarboxylase
LKHEIRYGKAGIRAYRAYGAGRPLFGSEVSVEVFGESFLPSYTAGDNRNVVATDTMKNFTYSALLEYDGDTHEAWCEHLGRRFLGTYPQMEWLRIRERELPFVEHSEKLLSGPVAGAPHGVVELEIGRDGVRSLRGGVQGLKLVKLTGSAFADFQRDEYTTLPERRDRPLYIFCDVRWRYFRGVRPIDPHLVAAECVEIFDGFVSLSIQHLLNEFGRLLLEYHPEVDAFSFEAQNRLWDTSAESASDPRRKVYSDPKPAHGLIGLTVRRS